MVDPTRQNLAWALEQTSLERDRRRQILERLPDQIVDVHSHANGSGAVGTISAYGWRQVRSSFPSWALEDTDRIRHLLFGDKCVRSVLIAQPYLGIDHRQANDYLLCNAVPSDVVALCGLPDDPDYTVDELKSGRYAALKMYPHFAEPPYQHVDEYFPPAAVRAAAVMDVPLILHLPKPLSACLSEVEALAKDDPDVRIVLAHLGRETHVDDHIERAFTRIAKLANVAADCSMATVPAVHRLALRTLGPDRIMFGSDTPMNLLRFTTFRHPTRGHRLMPPHRYHWTDDQMLQEYGHLAKNAILAHWQVLTCLIDAVESTYDRDSPEMLERVFNRNALTWFPAFHGPTADPSPKPAQR